MRFITGWTPRVAFALTAILLVGCQTSGSTSSSQPATGAPTAQEAAPKPPTPTNAFPFGAGTGFVIETAEKRLKPGNLVLHGGGGGRNSDGSDPFFKVSEFLTLTGALTASEKTICFIEAANPAAEPFSELSAENGEKYIKLGIRADNASTTTRDPKVLSAIERCTGFYFGGGAPELLSISLLEKNGSDTPALAAIRRRHAQGATVFGASAGAMMASKTMLCECGAGSSIEALIEGKLRLAPGLNFAPNVLIDAHFLERGLIGRLVEAMKVLKAPFALGLDENTAVLMPSDGSPWAILGESGAVIVRQTDSDKPYEALEIDLLTDGDRYDPKTRTVIVAPERQPMGSPQSTDSIIAEVFEPGGFSNLLRLAALNTYGRAAGLSKIATLANIRFTVTRTPETKVYFSPKLPVDRAYSITGLRLRINAPITRRGAA